MVRRQLLAERARLTGKERVDPTPVELPVDARPLTMEDRLKAYIRQQISFRAEQQGMASFDEEDDFDIEDDEEMAQPYPVQDMHPLGEPDSPQETLDGSGATPLPQEEETASQEASELPTVESGSG